MQLASSDRRFFQKVDADLPDDLLDGISGTTYVVGTIED